MLIKNSEEIANYSAKEGVTWIFIPPQSPHRGRLWESACCEVVYKYHFVRVTTGSVFSFKELATLSSQIENIMNDHPLCYRSATNETVEVSTPAHFLIGSTLKEILIAEIRNR